MERLPAKWERWKFLNDSGEPTIEGTIVEIETCEGQLSLRVLEENNNDEEKVWEEGNPHGLKHYWDWEAHEYLGKTSVEELLLNENEVIRDFAVEFREEIEAAYTPSDAELDRYSNKQKLKQSLEEADDEEFDKLIDGL